MFFIYETERSAWQSYETMVNDTKDMKWNNLSKSKREALQNLRFDESIVIKTADKGGAIVVMNKTDYVRNVTEDLDNENYYRKPPKDNTADITEEKQKLVEEIKQYLNYTEYKTIMDDTDTSIPVFYVLPKIHKNFHSFPPLRPIVAGYHSATVKLSESVDSYLKPAARKGFSYVRDTTHFLNRLKERSNIPRKAFMVTMDVNGLYNNIDHTEGADACYNIAMEKRRNKYLPSKIIRNIILFILRNNVFKFASSVYKQIMGTVIGTPMAPNYANLFMTQVETDMLNDYEAENGL